MAGLYNWDKILTDGTPILHTLIQLVRPSLRQWLNPFFKSLITVPPRLYKNEFCVRIIELFSQPSTYRSSIENANFTQYTHCFLSFFFDSGKKINYSSIAPISILIHWKCQFVAWILIFYQCDLNRQTLPSIIDCGVTWAEPLSTAPVERGDNWNK